MGKAQREGGLYRGTDGGFHDASGAPLSLSEVAEVDEALLTDEELDALEAEAEAGDQGEGDDQVAGSIGDQGGPGNEGEASESEDSDGRSDDGPPAGEAEGENGGHAEQHELPDDFPGAAEFRAQGFTTVEQVQELDDYESVEGVGPATAKKVPAAIEKALGGGED